MISLFDVPQKEACRLVGTGAPVYLTINPVEYHGPHLSLHNDRLISLGLIRDLHQRLGDRHGWPLLLGADLEWGVDPVRGRGTRHVRYRTVRKLVIEACRALAELGATKVVLMTFHGAPLHSLAIEAGVQALAAEGVRAVAPFNLVLRELLTLDVGRFAAAFAHVEDPAERQAMMRELPLDYHAGFFETSLALHYAPESVSPDYRSLPPCPEARPNGRLLVAARIARAMGAEELSRELDFAAAGIGWTALRPFPGYTGRPHRATPQAGAFFAAEMMRKAEPLVDEVLAGRASSPPPIMRWVAPVSLGGRIGMPARPRPRRGASLPDSGL
jgi:creatinine amidohydrolase